MLRDKPYSFILIIGMLLLLAGCGSKLAASQTNPSITDSAKAELVDFIVNLLCIRHINGLRGHVSPPQYSIYSTAHLLPSTSKIHSAAMVVYGVPISGYVPCGVPEDCVSLVRRVNTEICRSIAIHVY